MRKIGFQNNLFSENQKIPRRNSKRKLQNMVKRKLTRTKLEILYIIFPVYDYNLAQEKEGAGSAF
jgi:L,D-peptidoglycan transpeptidase YkuD (ErfK/YbiS/YcfS/YnhG family)